MATAVVSRQPSAQSPQTTLERSESASSTTTIQASQHNGSVQTASSSTSAQTLLSDSSSTAPKSQRTSASSTRAPDSYQSHKHRYTAQQEQQQQVALAPAFESEAPTASSGRVGRDGERNRGFYHRSESPSSTARRREPQGWNDRYASLDGEDDAFGAHDEETPMSYPPFDEETKEARKIQQTLEGWAAREKQKRKEMRSARTGSTIGAPNSRRLTKRLSMLGSVAGSKSRPEHLNEMLSSPNPPSPSEGQSTNSYDELAGDGRRLLDHASQRSGGAIGVAGLPAVADDGESMTERGSNDSGAKGKGKAREASDPFQDPATKNQPSQRTSNRLKPKPGMPIVTPGRAPTIRHRAIERAEATGAYSQAPSIVTTDTEEEQTVLAQLERIESNPFQTPDERSEDTTRDTGNGIRRPLSTALPIGTTIVDGASGRGDKALMRKSTSSRFNEIGLDDGDDADGWPDDADSSRETQRDHSMAKLQGRQKASRSHHANRWPEQEPDREQEAHATRRPWWTEWLCGIGPPRDDEGQSGRTFPE